MSSFDILDNSAQMLKNCDSCGFTFIAVPNESKIFPFNGHFNYNLPIFYGTTRKYFKSITFNSCCYVIIILVLNSNVFLFGKLLKLNNVLNLLNMIRNSIITYNASFWPIRVYKLGENCKEIWLGHPN